MSNDKQTVGAAAARGLVDISNQYTAGMSACRGRRSLWRDGPIDVALSTPIDWLTVSI